MQKRLHPVVLTVGIFQVLFGFSGMCCGGFGTIGVVAMLNDPKFATSNDPNPTNSKVAAGSPRPSSSPGMMEVQEEMTRRVPSYLYEQGFEAFANLFLGFLMIVSGIGLFFMQSWARWLAIFYAVLHILKNTIVLLYTLIFVLPVMNAIADEAATAGSGQAAGMKVGGIVGSFLAFSLVLYPILVCLLLLIPPVSRAFRGEPASDKPFDDFRERDDFHERFRSERDDDRFGSR